MSDRDFQVNGITFRLSKIDAIRQFHIVRRMAPMLKEFLPVLMELKAAGSKKSSEMTEAETFDHIVKLAGPFMEGLGKLTDADSDKVLFSLLSSVEMQQKEFGGNWARVAKDSMLMFSDMELPLLLNLAGRAFAHNLQGFFTVLPKVS